MKGQRQLVAGGVVLFVLTVLAVAGPWLCLHSPVLIPDGHGLMGPGRSYWFGTDELGRDVFARVVYGARSSVVVGAGAAALATLIGVFVGSVAAWWGRWLDDLLMRMAEVFLVLPGLMLAAVVVVVLGDGILTLVVALGVGFWPVVARVTRSAVLELKRRPFVEAGRISGLKSPRLLLRHVLPHAAAPVAVVSITCAGTAILSEAALSFLGIGIVEAAPSWGSMIANGQRYLSTSPHVVFFPAVFMFIAVLSFVMLADGLRKRYGIER